MSTSETIERKTQAFRQKVFDEADPKFKDLFEDFIQWWTQPSKSGKQIRYDGEKYFGINQRLATFRKNQKIEVKEQSVKAEVVSTGAYDNVMINDLKYVYNDEREGKYVKLKHGKGDSVYDFLRSKGVIKDPKSTPQYLEKRMHMARGLIYARVIDDLKTAEGEHKDQLEIRARSVREGKDHEIWPQAKALILTDVFNRYTLEEILSKIQ